MYIITESYSTLVSCYYHPQAPGARLHGARAAAGRAARSNNISIITMFKVVSCY